ncbi:MAG TPA: coniferyl aldehyde dehydrogenase [Alcanivoracaceae bacterium]|nr:coniferyl aldehyde dehydrogenase [Alcanivoracaceae bacterium]
MTSITVEAATQELQKILAAQREAYGKNPYPSLQERRASLDKLDAVVRNNVDLITATLNEDFGSRSEDETKIAEILTTLEGIKYYRKRIRRWMKPERRGLGLMGFPGEATVVHQPLGVIGVIVPWNYPVYLALGPLLAALAAGNRVMIKMSEFTPKTGEMLKKLLAEVFPEDHVAVINGELEVATAFSSLPFDHILFTGSTAVGRHIMRAAANNLTPVTLELGGKSPAIIGEDYPMKDAVERIAFGKCFNAGQTCVSPDYLLCPEQRIDEFVQEFIAQVSAMYPTIVNNPDVTSIINQRQHDRLQSNLADAEAKGAKIIRVNPANESFENTRKMPYTLVLNVTDEMKIAQEEIFGPIMLVYGYKTLEEAVAHVNARPRPLALYYFDWSNERANYVIAHTHSGGVCINDTMSHVAIDDLPFGGVGDSGMGQYHGREGFLTFTKPKSVFRKGRINGTAMLLPPFNRKTHEMVYKFLLKK